MTFYIMIDSRYDIVGGWAEADDIVTACRVSDQESNPTMKWEYKDLGRNPGNTRHYYTVYDATTLIWPERDDRYIQEMDEAEEIAKAKAFLDDVKALPLAGYVSYAYVRG